MLPYKLIFDIFNYDKSPWKENENWTICNLVVGVNAEKGKRIKRSKNKPEILSKMRFLFEELKRCAEDQRLLTKPLKQRVGLYITLLNVKKLFDNYEELQFLRNELGSWIPMLEAVIKHNLAESSMVVDNDVQSFFEGLAAIKEKTVPPISDLKPFEEENGVLKVREFVNKFTEQVNNNMGLLLKLDFTLVRHHLVVHRENIKICFDSKVPYIFTPHVVSRFRKVHTSVANMKDEILDMLDYCRNHKNFCQDLLERYHVHVMDPSRTNLHEYVERHEEVLSRVFNAEVVQLPIMVPQLTELRDIEMEIRTEESYKAIKSIYENLQEEINTIKRVTPTKWPQVMPNLSTHDAKPPLSITNGADFRVLMGAYASYLVKMGNLIDNLTLTVRRSFEFLESMSYFAPGVEFRGMCHTPRDQSRSINNTYALELADSKEVKKPRSLRSLSEKSTTLTRKIGTPLKILTRSEEDSSGENPSNSDIVGGGRKGNDVTVAKSQPVMGFRRRGSSEINTLPSVANRMPKKKLVPEDTKKTTKGFKKNISSENLSSTPSIISLKTMVTKIKPKSSDSLKEDYYTPLSHKPLPQPPLVKHNTEGKRLPSPPHQTTDSVQSHPQVSLQSSHPARLNQGRQSLTEHDMNLSKSSDMWNLEKTMLMDFPLSNTVNTEQEPSENIEDPFTEFNGDDESSSSDSEIWVKVPLTNPSPTPTPFPGFSLSSSLQNVYQQLKEQQQKYGLNLEGFNQEVKHYREWSVEEVAEWIDCMQLEPKYKDIFLRNKVNGKKLDLLKEPILHTIGIEAWGDRLDILDAIQLLQRKTM